MEYAILLRDRENDWGWYMNGYLVAPRFSNEELGLFHQKVEAVYKGEKYPLGTTIDRNQFTHPLWAQFTHWCGKKATEYKVRFALLNNSIAGY